MIHNPITEGPTADWPLHWRADRGFFERICPHGIGHIAIEQVEYWRAVGGLMEAVHGCDGCPCDNR